MSSHRSSSIVIAFTLVMITLPRAAEAQGFLDRLKKAATDVVAEEVMTQADALAGNLATLVVDDGGFMAIVSPWATADGTGTVDRASLSGHAVVAQKGSNFTLTLCEVVQAEGQAAWNASFVVSGPPSTVTQAPATETSAMAAREAPRGRTVARRAASEPAPMTNFAGEYPLSSNFVQATVATNAARIAADPEGTLHLDAVSEDLWAGTATLTLPAVYLPGDTEPRSVHVAVAFRAMPATAADAAATCRGMSR